MQQKPKSRDVTFVSTPRPQTRPGQAPPATAAPRPQGAETPECTKDEIRRLVEEDAVYSTTQIADHLNTKGFPSATGVKWTAANVDSVLGTLGLKETIRQLTQQEAPGAGVPIDLLEIRQLIHDTVRESLAAFSPPPGVNLDLQSLQQEVSFVKRSLADLTRQVADSSTEGLDAAVARATAEQVRTVLANTPLDSLERMTKRTAEHTVDVLKKIDGAMDDLGGAIDKGFQTADQRLTSRMDDVARVLSDVGAEIAGRIGEEILTDPRGTIAQILGGIVDARLKQVHDEMMQRQALIMGRFTEVLEGLRREVEASARREASAKK